MVSILLAFLIMAAFMVGTEIQAGKRPVRTLALVIALIAIYGLLSSHGIDFLRSGSLT